MFTAIYDPQHIVNFYGNDDTCIANFIWGNDFYVTIVDGERMHRSGYHILERNGYILLILFVFMLSQPAGATEFYQYEVDGKIVYSDTPPKKTDYKVKKTRETYVVSHQPYASRSQWRVIPTQPEDFHPYIRKASQKYGISSRLIHSIIKIESNYNPKAVSRKGAQGLMQIMPKTAKMLGLEKPFDPAQNIDAGVRYFKKLLDHFQGNTALALAAYNAGLTNVEKHGGIPPFPETINYVKKIKNYYSQL